MGALPDAYRKFDRQFVEARMKAGVSAPGRFETLANDLAHRGWASSRIEEILGANFARLFRDVWDA